MSLSLIRVDDRLIHGQVVEAWIPSLDICEIVVVSDEIVQDDMRKTIMRFATPEDIELKIMSVKDAVKYLPIADKSDVNVFVLTPGLEEIIKLLDGGANISELNIGGMHYSAGKNQSIGRAIFLSDNDSDCLKNISNRGIKIEGRGVPSDKPVDLMKVINS